MGKRLILLLGGARSGKSHYAETWAREHGREVLFVATAQTFDEETQTRIQRHQSERPAHWYTLENPVKTGAHIQRTVIPHDTLVLDCITLLFIFSPLSSGRVVISRFGREYLLYTR